MLGFLRSLRDRRRARRLARETPAETFTRYFRENTWGDRESVSGKGSNLAATEALRAALPDVFREFGVTSLLDVPCGDFHWMSRLDLTGIDYTGGDIVAELIAANRQRYGAPGIAFEVINLIESDLPRADMVFTRDCLVHLSFADAIAAIANIRRSGSRHLMATTFPGTERNVDILTGQWRAIDLCKPPFDFPPPLRLVREGFRGRDGEHGDKSMGIWAIADLPDF
ncbi:hypothetical protein [Albidovulum sp.]